MVVGDCRNGKESPKIIPGSLLDSLKKIKMCTRKISVVKKESPESQGDYYKKGRQMAMVDVC